MRVAVLGAGAWGTALAKVLADNGHETVLWTWQEAHARALREDGCNREFLPGVRLPEQLRPTADMADAVKQAALLVVVVPSQAVRPTLESACRFLTGGVPIVCASKGVETGSLQLMSEVIESVAGASRPLAVVSGPSFAKEVAAQVPTNLVAASRHPDFSHQLQETLSTPWLRIYSSDDPVGVEIGGALKNVIAIAAGACDGLGLGANTRAALITRGIAEMARLSARKGGQVLTMAGLAGMGDLVLTCTGEMSRNRTLGYRLGSGVPLSEALDSSEGVAEGYVTSLSAVQLARQLGVELPICEAVHSVLHDGKSPKEALVSLLARPLRSEWEPSFLREALVGSPPNDGIS